MDPLRPESLEGAENVDRETLGGWLRARDASDGLLAVAEAWYAIGSSSVPIDEMSLLAYAAKRAAGAGGPFSLRLEGGPVAVVGLAAAGAEARIGRHPREHGLEVVLRQLEVDVELADEVVGCVDGGEPGVERLDDAGADGPCPGFTMHHLDEGQLGLILRDDRHAVVARTVVDDDPLHRLDGLPGYGAEGFLNVFGLVLAG